MRRIQKPRTGLDVKGIVTDQDLPEEKRVAARQLRKDMTEAERRLWQALRNGQMNGHRFRRQQVLDGYIVDFYCHSLGLVVEVDGPVHDQQQEYDQARDKTLAMRGLTILRFKNQEVMDDILTVLRRISTYALKQPTN
ncbi:MAG: endonuclease domain-containing protein [Chloroflexi bacterium]|nr:endonuclease domain-containing protein [Chloroflexota bacterium]